MYARSASCVEQEGRNRVNLCKLSYILYCAHLNAFLDEHIRVSFKVYRESLYTVSESCVAEL